MSEIMELAVAALNGETLLDFRDFNDREQTSLCLFIAKKNLRIARKEALKSVYKGDCDIVVFDHYRKSKDLVKALVK